MIFSSARQYFYLEVQQPDEYIDLARAALYIAQEEYPTVDPEEYLNTLDHMAVELQDRLPVERYPLRVIQTINQYLYGELGFSGNKENYYDPRNSFLNDVIERRLGIPISLAVLYLELARRVDFPMVGIGMPGHFLIRPDIPNMEIFVDTFNEGEVLFLQDCQEKLSQVYQQPVKLQPEYLPKVTTSQILARMLSNLKYIYLKQQELEKALAAVERILLVFPDTTLELRDRGLIFYQLGQFSQSVSDLETYLLRAPEAEDVPAIRRLLIQMGKTE
jgi:regulator of sirC expression with transglutaminase-like and TPR domain